MRHSYTRVICCCCCKAYSLLDTAVNIEQILFCESDCGFSLQCRLFACRKVGGETKWMPSLRSFSWCDLCCCCCRHKVAEPEVRYDPVRLEEQLFKQPVKWLVRNVELFVPLGTFVAKVIFDIQVQEQYTHVKCRLGGRSRVFCHKAVFACRYDTIR